MTITTVGSTADANAILTQTLAQYGLQSMDQWAWGEITNGSSSDQVINDLYQTPQFAQRFPGIIARQKAGLSPISPSEYIAYEDNAKQMEHRYSLPAGMLSDPTRIGTFIGQDVSAQELTDRVQNGYAQVAFAPPEVRQQFTTMFGANGDGALAAHFLDPTIATDLLTKQATASQIAGNASMGSINMSPTEALTLAQQGQTGTSVGSNFADLEKNAALYNAQVSEKPGLNIGDQGVQAEFGQSQNAVQQVLQREQQRQAAFQGGGRASADAQGAEGVGAARPI